MIENQADQPTRAYVLYPDTGAGGPRAPQTALEEATSLAAALPGIDVIGAQVVRLPRVQPGTLFGSGKLEELAAVFQADRDQPWC